MRFIFGTKPNEISQHKINAKIIFFTNFILDQIVINASNCKTLNTLHIDN